MSSVLEFTRDTHHTFSTACTKGILFFFTNDDPFRTSFPILYNYWRRLVKAVFHGCFFSNRILRGGLAAHRWEAVCFHVPTKLSRRMKSSCCLKLRKGEDVLLIRALHKVLHQNEETASVVGNRSMSMILRETNPSSCTPDLLFQPPKPLA